MNRISIAVDQLAAFKLQAKRIAELVSRITAGLVEVRKTNREDCLAWSCGYNNFSDLSLVARSTSPAEEALCLADTDFKRALLIKRWGSNPFGALTIDQAEAVVIAMPKPITSLVPCQPRATVNQTGSFGTADDNTFCPAPCEIRDFFAQYQKHFSTIDFAYHFKLCVFDAMQALLSLVRRDVVTWNAEKEGGIDWWTVTQSGLFLAENPRMPKKRNNSRIDLIRAEVVKYVKEHNELPIKRILLGGTWLLGNQWADVFVGLETESPVTLDDRQTRFLLNLYDQVFLTHNTYIARLPYLFCGAPPAHFDNSLVIFDKSGSVNLRETLMLKNPAVRLATEQHYQWLRRLARLPPEASELEGNYFGYYLSRSIPDPYEPRPPFSKYESNLAFELAAHHLPVHGDCPKVLREQFSRELPLASTEWGKSKAEKIFEPPVWGRQNWVHDHREPRGFIVTDLLLHKRKAPQDITVAAAEYGSYSVAQGVEDYIVGLAVFREKTRQLRDTSSKPKKPKPSHEYLVLVDVVNFKTPRAVGMVRATVNTLYPYEPFVRLYGYRYRWPGREIVNDEQHLVAHYLRARSANNEEIAAYDEIRVPDRSRPRAIMFAPDPCAYLSRIESAPISLPPTLLNLPADLDAPSSRVAIFSQRDRRCSDLMSLPKHLLQRATPYFLDFTEMTIGQLFAYQTADEYQHLLRAADMEGLRLTLTKSGWKAAVESGAHRFVMEGTLRPAAVLVAATIDGVTFKEKVSNRYPTRVADVALPWQRMCNCWNEPTVSSICASAKYETIPLRDGFAEFADYVLHGSGGLSGVAFVRWLSENERYETMEFSYVRSYMRSRPHTVET